MSKHKFSVGDTVFLKESLMRTTRGTGGCKVVATLPATGNTRQYRVRYETENFDRCIAEDDIDPTRSHSSKKTQAPINKEKGPWLKASSVRIAK